MAAQNSDMSDDSLATSEKGLLISMLALMLYMFVGSFSFAGDVAQFPRFTTGGAIACMVLLLLRRYLPSPIQTFVTEPVDITQQADESQEREDELQERADRSTEKAENDLNRSIPSEAFVVASTCGYALLSFLFGILWITPLFIVVYTIWFQLSRYATVGLAIGGFMLAYLFIFLLNIGIDEGLLFGGFTAIEDAMGGVI